MMVKQNACKNDKSVARIDRKNLKVVGIGGGTGLSVLLSGLKQFTRDITAIVSVADDGGSSGRLRGEFGILPPGDIRNCLVSLSSGESLLGELIQYRFASGELEGHNMGNLLMAALCDLMGGFDAAVQEMGKLLNVSGRVLPVTLDRVVLGAKMTDGTVIYGQSLIPFYDGRLERVFLDPPDCHPLPAVISAINSAEVIVIGPGSLYTSIMPGLLVKGVAEAVRQSGARKIFVCNIMTQPGETDGYTASDHVKGLHDHVGKLEGCVLVNTGPLGKARDVRTGREIVPVVPDFAELEKMGVVPLGANLTNTGRISCHDPQKLAKAICDLCL